MAAESTTHQRLRKHIIDPPAASISIPGQQTAGLGADDLYLYASTRVNGNTHLSKVEIATGEEIARFPPAFEDGVTGYGAGTDPESRLFAADFKTSQVLTVDPTTGETSRGFDVPFDPAGITYDPDRESVWISNITFNEVHEFSPSGTERRSFEAQSTVTPAGIGYHNGFVWLGDKEDPSHLYKYTPDGTLRETREIGPRLNGVAGNSDGVIVPDGTGDVVFTVGGPSGAEEPGESTDSWSQQQKLSADDGDDFDGFGQSAALSADGTTALIGAFGDDEPNGRNAGSAYVFTRSDGSWSQQQKLSADDGDADDLFGVSAALSADGTTALLGAQGDEDPNGDDAGSAYVFTRSDGSWSQQQKLSADDGDDNDLFGTSAALSGDGTTALLGAFADEDPNGPEAGSAYVFTRSDGSWSQQQKLSADDGDADDGFGTSAALSADGTTALLSAERDDEPNGDDAGSAYVFTRSDGSWSQQQKLSADDGDDFDGFGQSAALSADGTTALIGAQDDEEPERAGCGSAYAFTRSDGSWSQQQKLSADDGDDFDGFGSSAALSADGTTALLGAFADEDPNGDDAGSAYVFTRSDGSWSQQQKLSADDGDAGDGFGFPAALSADGTTALIGASLDEDPNGRFAGSAYVFTSGESGTIRPNQLKLTATPAPPTGIAPGGIEKISLRVKNTSDKRLTDVQFGLDPSSYPDGWKTVQSIENSLPSDEFPQLNQFAGSWDASTATWTIDSLEPGATASAAITVTAPDSASVGTTATLTARCGRDSANDVTTSVTIDIVDRFDPTVHGFGFNNWAERENVWPSHDHNEVSRREVRQLMGALINDLAEAVREDDDLAEAVRRVLNTSETVLTRALVSLMYPILTLGTATDGHCYGMVYAAQEYFKQPDTLPVSTAETANDITAPTAGSDAVGSDIDFYQNSQYFDNDAVVLLLLLGLQQVPAPQQTLDSLRQTIKNEGVASVALSESGERGGHQVLAYAVTDTADTTEVHVYDPTSPASGDQRPGFNHWAKELEGGTAIARETSITFETGDEPTTVRPYDGYDQIAPLIGGGDIDVNRFSALSISAQSLEAFATEIINLVSFEFSLDLDDSSSTQAVGSTTAQTEAEPISESVNVSVTDPNGESVFSIGPESGVDTSQYEFDVVKYDPSASTGEYNVTIESSQPIEYTARARGTTADGGEIDDTARGTVADGGPQQVTATIPDSSSESGTIDPSTAGPSLSASVQQAGTPGGQARVQYTVSNVSGQASVALEFTTPSQLSANAGASETSGTFGPNGQQLVFTQPDGEVTATVAFDIASDASTDTTFDIDTEVLDETSTTTDSVTTTVGDVETGPVERFDADDDGDISLTEVQDAIRAFSNGELDLQGVQQVIAAFSS